MRWQKPRPRTAESDRFLPSNDIIDIQIKPFHGLNQQCLLYVDRIRDSLWLLGPNRQGPHLGVNVG